MKNLQIFQIEETLYSEHGTLHTADCSTLGRVEQGLLVVLDGRDSRDGADIFLDQEWL